MYLRIGVVLVTFLLLNLGPEIELARANFQTLLISPTTNISGVKRPDLEEKVDDDQLRTFSLLDIKIATNNFSDANRLGQGGYGPVYKVN